MTLSAAPTGAFGPAVVAAGPSGLAFLSGIGPAVPGAIEPVPAALDAQLALTFEHLEEVLDARDLGWRNVAKVLLHLTDVREHDAVWAAFSDHFGDSWTPARTTIEVDNLPARGARLQLDVIAAG